MKVKTDDLKSFVSVLNSICPDDVGIEIVEENCECCDYFCLDYWRKSLDNSKLEEVDFSKWIKKD